MASGKRKRKQWAAESMEEACNALKNERMSLREASRKYNVPVETLRRRTTGLVSLDCRPGPHTVLTSEEEARLAQYYVTMADMGFGVTREGVMAIAYAIADKIGRDHPLRKAMLAEGGTKVSWLGKPLSHCAHPSHCPMPELSVQTRKQSMIFSRSLEQSTGD